MSFAWGDGNRFPSLLLNPLGVYPKAGPTETPIQGVSYDGQLWDARALVLKLIQSAKRSLILIDNWATLETLDLFARKRKGVKVTILTSEHYAVHPHPHMPKIPRHNSSDFCYTTPTHEIIMHTAENQIVVYQPNETVRLDVRLENDTVWLTQAQLCDLFGIVKSNVSCHLKNIFGTNELDYVATVQKIRTVRTEAKFIRRAKKELIVIDAYPGVATLDMLAKRGLGEREAA